MKKLLFFCLVIFFTARWSNAYCQATAGQQQAGFIAQKMRDSLLLTQAQYDNIYQINLRLIESKALVRKQHRSLDSVRINLQRIENTRDILYKPVLGSEEKYLIYRKKKNTLLSAN